MFFLYRPIIRWAARRALIGRNRNRSEPSVGRFTRAEVDHYLAEAWRRYETLVPSLPSQPTRGSRMNVQLAALTISIFQVLLDAGIERAYAIELVADTTWKVYQQWGRIGQFLARILPKALTKPAGMEADPKRRIRKDGTFALTFPFNPPGYLAKYVPTKGAIGFDMIRCPVAEVFRAQGAVDLCRASWCDLDYALAEMQGRRLQRTTTLVEGADRCDFRFIPASQVAKAGLPSLARLGVELWQRARADQEVQEVAVSIRIAAPAATIFTAIGDPRKPFLTSNPLTAMTVTSERTRGVGTVYHWTFMLPLGLRFQFDEVVTAWVENERFAYRAVSGWQMEAVTQLTPESGGTCVHFTLRYRLSGVWKWVIPHWLAQLGCRWALTNLRNHIEPKPVHGKTRMDEAVVVTAYVVDFAAPAEEVFRVVGDPRSKLVWVPAIKRVEMSSPFSQS